MSYLCYSTAGVGNYFTRRARFGKTVEASGRTLIGKQGEDLFFLEITVRIIFGDHGLSLKITVFFIPILHRWGLLFENHCHP